MLNIALIFPKKHTAFPLNYMIYLPIFLPEPHSSQGEKNHTAFLCSGVFHFSMRGESHLEILYYLVFYIILYFWSLYSVLD